MNGRRQRDGSWQKKEERSRKCHSLFLPLYRRNVSKGNSRYLKESKLDALSYEIPRITGKSLLRNAGKLMIVILTSMSTIEHFHSLIIH